MEIPSWMNGAIEQRLDELSARIQRHPGLRQYRAQEEHAFKTMLDATGESRRPAFLEWEDKHNYKRALENEELYLQGMRDGVQLAMALLSDPYAMWDIKQNRRRQD